MTTWDIGSLNDAFECLSETLQEHIDLLQSKATNLTASSKFEKAKETIDLVQDFVAYKERLQEFRSELPRAGGKSKRKRKRGGGVRSTRTRVSSTDMTPVEDFMDPVLLVLHDEGGSAGPAIIFPLLEEKLTESFKDGDCERLSGSNGPRWQQTARRCRSLLIEKGFLKNDAPRGLWELSDKGWKRAEEKLGKKPKRLRSV